MLSLIAASAYFLLIHFGVSGTRLRDELVARLGAGAYRGAFALASVVGLVWMSYAYRRAPTVELWGLVLGLRPAAYVLVFIAFLFVVIGLTTPSPTRVGMESKVGQGPEAARGIVRITRHPFLWGVALWALVHLIVNGDLASLIFFGSLLVLAVVGTLFIDAKRDVRRSVCRHSRREKPPGAGACGDRTVATPGSDSRLRGGVLSPRAVGTAAHLSEIVLLCSDRRLHVPGDAPGSLPAPDRPVSCRVNRPESRQ